MEYGWLSLIPPLTAILLAFLTRKVFLSLILGILLGEIITAQGDFFQAFLQSFFLIWNSAELGNLVSWEKFQNSWNIYTAFFLLLLGVIISLIHRAGGAYAYGEWASRKIKSRRGAKLSTMLLGILIFFDDYFNSLTVGTVMAPVTDKFKISRAKLAYILDSTAAPIVILAPVSSWVAEVLSQLKVSGVENISGESAFFIFIKTISFNTYAWLTLLMVFWISFKDIDFGLMKNHEDHALKTGDLYYHQKPPSSHLHGQSHQKHGTVLDLILPILFLVFAVIGGMLFTGDYWAFGGDKSLKAALESMNSVKSLFWGGLASLVFTLFLFVPRRLVGLKELPSLFYKGISLTLPSVLILILAWSIGSLIKNDLKTGQYLASLLSSNFPLFILPALFFFLSCFMAFSTGTSWGTFGIVIPIGVAMASSTNLELLIPILAATIAGAIYGDHASPISDTTILSSTGAGCHHIDHVKTQFPYCTLVAGCCVIGFLFAGFFSSSLILSAFLNFTVSFILLFLILKTKAPFDRSSQ